MSSVSGESQATEVEIDEDEDSAREPTEQEVREYAEYLGLDLETEQHLLWIAREGVVAPVPHPWKACQDEDEVFYFNFETQESIWAHPSDAYYTGLLEKHRKGEGSKSSDKAAASDGSGDEQPPASVRSASSGSSPKAQAKPAVGLGGSRSGSNLPSGTEDSKDQGASAEDSKSFVSEAVDSGSEDLKSGPRSPASARGRTASSRASSPEQGAREEAEGSKTFVSDVVTDEEEGADDKAAGSQASSPWSDRSSRSNSRSPRGSEDQKNRGLRSASSSPRASQSRQRSTSSSPRSARSDDDKSAADDRPAASPDNATKSPAGSAASSPVGRAAGSPSAAMGRGVGLASAVTGNLNSEAPTRKACVLDHSGAQSARSSCLSEVSEDFRSDWGAPSPLGSARSNTGGKSSNGTPVAEGQSLEVSASVETSSLISGLGLSASHSAAFGGPMASVPELKEEPSRLGPKTWAGLGAELRVLQEVLLSMGELRSKHAEFLQRLKTGK